MKADPLFLEVLVALGAGNLTIGPIHCDGEFVYGIAEIEAKGKRKGRVRIDPSTDVCDTACHELLHRIRPKWSEKKVRAQTRVFMRSLSHKERDKLYELIYSVAKVKRRPLVMEAE